MYSGLPTGDKGEWFQLYHIGFGGIPGRPFGDGPGRALAVAELHQRAERVPRVVLPAAHRALRDRRRHRRCRAAPRRQRHRRRLPVPGAGHDLHPRRSLAHLPLGRQRRRAGRARSQVDRARRRHPGGAAEQVHDVPVSRRRRAALRHLGRRRLGRPARARPRPGRRWRSAAAWSAPRAPRRYGVVLAADGSVDAAATGTCGAAAGRPARASRRCSTSARRARILAERDCQETGRRPRRPPGRRRERCDRRVRVRGSLRLGFGAGGARRRHLRGLLRPGRRAVHGPRRLLRLGRPGDRAAREAGVPVLHTPGGYQPGGVDGGLFRGRSPRCGLFDEGCHSGSRCPSVAPRPGNRHRQAVRERLLRHVARLNTEARGIDTLVIFGVTTSGCVRATAVDAIQHGFLPIVVRDAVGDRVPARTRPTCSTCRPSTPRSSARRPPWPTSPPPPEVAAGDAERRCEHRRGRPARRPAERGALLSTEDKVELIDRAVAAGVRRVEVAVVRPPRAVPQMADAEAVMAAVPRADGGRLRRPGAQPARPRPRPGRRRRRGQRRRRRHRHVQPAQPGRRPPTRDALPAGRSPGRARDAGSRHDRHPRPPPFGCPFEGEVARARVRELAEQVAAAGRRRDRARRHHRRRRARRRSAPGVDAVARRRRRRRRCARTSTTPATPATPTRSPRSRPASTSLDASIGGIGGCPFAPTPPATSPPRTSSTCSTAWASAPAWTSRPPRPRPPGWRSGWPSASPERCSGRAASRLRPGSTGPPAPLG